jgi:hypothetical protein
MLWQLNHAQEEQPYAKLGVQTHVATTHTIQVM